jgi:hypothetical protein
MRLFYFNVLFLLSLFSSHSFGQECDIIILKSGEEIASQVLEIRISEIAYKKCDFTTGPTYVFTKAEVFMIKYKNGQKEMFGTEALTTESAVVRQSERQYLEDIFTEKIKGEQKVYWETTCFNLFLMDGTQTRVKVYHYSAKQTIFKPCDDTFLRTSFSNQELNYIEDEQHLRYYFNRQ